MIDISTPMLIENHAFWGCFFAAVKVHLYYYSALEQSIGKLACRGGGVVRRPTKSGTKCPVRFTSVVQQSPE